MQTWIYVRHKDLNFAEHGWAHISQSLMPLISYSWQAFVDLASVRSVTSAILSFKEDSVQMGKMSKTSILILFAVYNSHWRTALYWQQTQDDKHFMILLQLNAYKGFNWTHFRISLHIFDKVRTSLWETDHTIGWIIFEVRGVRCELYQICVKKSWSEFN